jgi:hypothetical protein
MAHAQLSRLSDAAVVVGAPPRTTIPWGLGDHLDDLLCSIEQVNFRVLRNVFAYEGKQLVIADSTAADAVRNSPVIVVDNVFVKGRTVRNLATKLAEIGASEIHLCIMGRWLDGLPEAIRAAEEYRASICPDPAEIGEWYRSVFTAL